MNLVTREARDRKARTHQEFASAISEVKGRRVTQRNPNRFAA